MRLGVRVLSLGCATASQGRELVRHLHRTHHEVNMADGDSQDAESTQSIYPHPGGKKKSEVWKYFGFYKVNQNLPPVKSNLDMKSAVCRLCRKSYKNNGNTTNFHSHIHGEHMVAEDSPGSTPVKAFPTPTKTGIPTNSAAPKSMVQRTLMAMPEKKTLGPEKKKEIEDKLLKLLVGKVLPPSLVDNQHFKEFVAALDSRYQLPSRKTVIARLEKKRDEVESKIRKELQSVEGIGITHDGWTSNTTESYNTTTIHYIRDWTLKCSVLNTVKIEGSHTAQKIADSLLEVKAKWNLPDKLVATTDNAANERKAFEILGWQRFGCYGHKLNLVVSNAMSIPAVSKILGKNRKLVTLFHTSTSVNDKLMEKQKLLLSDNARGHKLIADVPTRWNSSLDMLKRVLEQLPALMAVATDEAVSKSARTTIQNCLLTFNETSLAESIVAVLEPFKKATEAVCSETNPTINKVLPVVTKLYRVLEVNEGDPATIRALKDTMQKQLDLRAVSVDLCLLGTILNPYTKGFEHMPEKQGAAEQLLRSAVKEMVATTPLVSMVVKKEKDDNNNSEPASPPLPSVPLAPALLESPAKTVDIPDDSEVNTGDGTVHRTEQLTEMPQVKKPKLSSADTDDWLSDVMCVGESLTSPEDLMRDEINRYLRHEFRRDDIVVTVLEWWRKNEMFFPRLSKLAKSVLCVQASSVPSERVFSLAGELVSKKRSRMSPENVDMFIFLNRNLGKFW